MDRRLPENGDYLKIPTTSWVPTLTVVGQNIYASNPTVSGSSSDVDPVPDLVDEYVRREEATV